MIFLSVYCLVGGIYKAETQADLEWIFLTIMSIQEMELSTKQSEKFVNRYIDRYAEKDENWNVITPVDIPRIPVEKQREDMIEWAKIIYEILWKTKAKSTYKYRLQLDWKKKRETLFEKALYSLFLQYWPTYVEEDWQIAKNPLWWEDVIDIKKFLKTWEI